VTTVQAELATLCTLALALWLAFLYAFGRLWSWRHNRKRRAEYRRSSARKRA